MFDPELLAEWESRWGIAREWQRLSELHHLVYRVVFSKATLIVKVAPPPATGNRTPRTGGGLAKEREVLQWLAQHQFPVPCVAGFGESSGGRSLDWLALADVGHETLAEAAHHRVQQGETRRAKDLYRQLGETLARLHRITWPTCGILDYSAERRTLETRPRDMQVWRESLEKAGVHAVQRGWIAEHAAMGWLADDSGLRADDGHSLCHGDYHALQVLVVGDMLTAVVDWEQAWVGNPQIDFAVALTNLEMYADEACCEEFVVAYSGASLFETRRDPRILYVQSCQALALMVQADRQRQVAKRDRAIVLYDALRQRATERTRP